MFTDCFAVCNTRTQNNENDHESQCFRRFYHFSSIFEYTFVRTWFNLKRICHSGARARACVFVVFNTLRCVFLACQMCIKCLYLSACDSQNYYNPPGKPGKRCGRSENAKGKGRTTDIYIYLFILYTYINKVLFFVPIFYCMFSSI